MTLKRLIKLEEKIREFGFDFPNAFAVLDQMVKECNAQHENHTSSVVEDNTYSVKEEVEDLLRTAIALAVEQKIDIDSIINHIDNKVSKHFNFVQSIAHRQGLRNFKGQNIEYLFAIWMEIAYITKNLIAEESLNENIVVRLLLESDIQKMGDSFSAIHKPQEVLRGYVKQSIESIRTSWVALYKGDYAGFVTLLYKSEYPPFLSEGIPEINDLNVLPKFRTLGIGSKLIHVAEVEAQKKGGLVGIGVGLYGGSDGGYGAAQKLYIELGYVPDGRGVSYANKLVNPYKHYRVDDDLILWMTKKI